MGTLGSCHRRASRKTGTYIMPIQTSHLVNSFDAVAYTCSDTTRREGSFGRDGTVQESSRVRTVFASGERLYKWERLHSWRPSSFLERPSSFLERPSSFLERPSSFLERPSPLTNPLHKHESQTFQEQDQRNRTSHAKYLVSQPWAKSIMLGSSHERLS